MTEVNLPTGFDLNDLIAAEVHELKNQLGQLTLSLDEIAADRPDVAAALHEPRHVCHIVGDSLVRILTLYKSQRARISLNVEAHSPREFIEELKAEVESLSDRVLSIELRSDQAPPFSFFDRYLVEIALSNALHNATRFAASRIVIGAEAKDSGLLLYIHDDSRGFPDHVLESQGRQPGKSATGTGLGLYFAQAIAAAHNNKGRCGELRLENRAGAYFAIWLP